MAVGLFVALWTIEAPGPRAILIEARNLAYDANYRNDQAGLRAAIASLEPLVDVPDVAPYAHYYVSWAYWALAASRIAGKDPAGALESARRSVEHARAGLLLRDEDPEFHTALAHALVAVGFLDGSQFKSVTADLAAARKRALELGPANPRVVMMDAGAIFNSPPSAGGSRERGLSRWQEALALFEAEANAAAADPLAPRWGYALAQGWLASLHLRMTPPQKEQACRAAEIALRMRPDFWWVREQVLPQIAH